MHPGMPAEEGADRAEIDVSAALQIGRRRAVVALEALAGSAAMRSARRRAAADGVGMYALDKSGLVR